MVAKQIVVDGILTSYFKEGSGPIILLLHGWGDNNLTFDKLAAALAAKYTVLIPDLPGFGQSASPSEVWDLDNYAGFLGSFLKKNNEQSLYAVIGHSNGGALAIHALSNNYLSADKLVLMASSGIRDRQKTRRLVLKGIAKTGKAATVFLPSSTRQKLRKKLYGAAGSDMFVAPHIQETFKKTVRQDVQDDAHKLSLPTLLLYGGNDTATPPLFGQIYHRLIENSRLEIIPEAGHFIHLDKPGEVTESIKEFL
jgi:pimeloyl-ACP methyl ester carboxylesterase